MKLNVRFVVSSPNLTVTFAKSVEEATNFFGNYAGTLGDNQMSLLALNSTQIGGNTALGVPCCSASGTALTSRYTARSNPALHRYVNAMRALLIAATDDVTSVTVEGQ
jgi:hypothetical protein